MTSAPNLVTSQKQNLEMLIRVRASNKTKLATDAELGRTYVDDFLKKAKKPMPIEPARKLARTHRISLVYLMEIAPLPSDPAEILPFEGDDEANETEAAAPSPNAEMAGRVKFSRDLVHIYGEAAGGPDGRFRMNGKELESHLRPPSLADVRDGYGVFVRGTSMLDRYEDGDTVYVAPHRPFRTGHYVVAQIRIDEDDVPSGYVKRFVSQSKKELVLEQLNPAPGEDRIMRFPGDRVVSVHKIVGSKSD
ncbi:S24 family peptidase [Methylobacterium brachythecii]|uniref:Phage repressor protein C with HTH and peptisase S24 domain n=1 Tax=Methylobacterium brachythecii TaxID=1176177 RepID=A0A7W6ASD1_9HYPH|nr:helix-turn-helix transcriptional regulator [Methylobacterium brachythecii]MBB3905087.1 phage repressor protein C with HTH and peptisase S24 domain [Methylobacterium brachythecii]GLS44406.1 hypothetical protein GCM10007884_23940 [Methylobacterium brachythecii]